MALRGIKVLELAGLAPAPMCGMLLLDYGADVLRIDRVKSSMNYDVLSAGKRSIALDLKHPSGKDVFVKLCKRSDVVLDPYRPGVLESLELSPEKLVSANERLIVARLTGYGQTGPLAQRAGHDINYLAMSGVLSMLGKHPDPPTPPVNLLADFAGGSLLCAYAILAAIIERATTGRGKIIDFSLSEGSAYISSWLFRSKANAEFSSFVWPKGDQRGCNLLDGGHPLYRAYATRDPGGFIAVGALEPQFAQQFMQRFQCPDLLFEEIISNPSKATEMIADHFKTKTREEWNSIFEGSDACATPVLNIDEAPNHPHNQFRSAFRSLGSTKAPAPIPKSADGDKTSLEPEVGQHSEDVLKELGYEPVDIAEFLNNGVIEGTSLSKSKL